MQPNNFYIPCFTIWIIKIWTLIHITLFDLFLHLWNKYRYWLVKSLHINGGSFHCSVSWSTVHCRLFWTFLSENWAQFRKTEADFSEKLSKFSKNWDCAHFRIFGHFLNELLGAILSKNRALNTVFRLFNR